MGLFSALFGGGKAAKDKPARTPKVAPVKAAPVKAAKAAEKAVKSADVLVLTPKGAGPVAGVTELRLAYAAYDRAGAHDKAYATAARLVAIYKACGAVALKKLYRAAAERHLLARVAQVSRDKRVPVVVSLRRRMDVVPAAVVVAAAATVAGPEAAKLLAAHGAWLKAAGK